MSERVQFHPGVPVEVILAKEGELISGTWKDIVVYQLQDGRALYLESDVAASLNEMEIQVGEKFFVCKYFADKEKRQTAWNVWLAPETEKARAAKEAPEIERQLRESIVQAQIRRNGNGRTAKHATAPPEPPAPFRWSEFLLAETEALSDVYAAALAYSSERHGNAVKPEDIRTLVVTAFINLSQRGGVHAA